MNSYQLAEIMDRKCNFKLIHKGKNLEVYVKERFTYFFGLFWSYRWNLISTLRIEEDLELDQIKIYRFVYFPQVLKHINKHIR